MRTIKIGEGGGVYPLIWAIQVVRPKRVGFLAVLVMVRVSISAILIMNRIWF